MPAAGTGLTAEANTCWLSDSGLFIATFFFFIRMENVH